MFSAKSKEGTPGGRRDRECHDIFRQAYDKFGQIQQCVTLCSCDLIGKVKVVMNVTTIYNRLATIYADLLHFPFSVPSPSIRPLSEGFPNHIDPWLGYFEKYRNTPSMISITTALAKSCPLVGWKCCIHRPLCQDTPPIYIILLLQKHQGEESLEHSQFTIGNKIVTVHKVFCENYPKIWARLRGQNYGDRENPNADFRRKPQIFADSPFSPANSSIWRALRSNRKGGTASLRARTCVKRNAVFSARVLRVFLCIFYIKEGI